MGEKVWGKGEGGGSAGEGKRGLDSFYGVVYGMDNTRWVGYGWMKEWMNG